MAKDSLKNLLNKFPYFLDKREESNFYKSQDVTNKRFQEISQDIFNVLEGFRLNKRCLIWKEQNVPIDYSIHFVANYPHMKTVICYKNDEVICREDYSYDDNVSSFIYLYDSTMENDTLMSILNDNEWENEENDDEDVEEETPIIPEDKFSIYIETYDEIIIEKGFPENDTIMNDIFDHDLSLDRFGSLNNIPRKKYIPTEDYPHTEPPYNNCLTEDDYHYFNRIIEYNLRLHDTPLPVLEIWKLYGLEATMLNRERLLLKFFDQTRHGFDSKEEKVLNWSPKPWEHKDGWGSNCGVNLGKYFFVTANTNFPKKWSDILFNFKLINNLGEELEEDFCVKIFLNGVVKEEFYTKKSYPVSHTLLDESNVNIFKFIAYDKDYSIISEDELEIKVQGCNNADFYVSSEGDDTLGDGSSDNPFATLNKALEEVTDVKNLIAVKGEVNISDAAFVNNNCTIIGCKNNDDPSIIHNDISNRFFNVIGNKNLNLSLIDIYLDSNGTMNYYKNSHYLNNNKEYKNYLTVLVNGGEPTINFNIDKDNYFTSYDNIIVSGTLKSKENIGIKNANLEIILGEIMVNESTNNDGEFTAVIPISEFNVGEHDIIVAFEGSDTYIDTQSTKQVNINKNPVILNVTYGNDATITSTGHTPGDHIKFYDGEGLIDTIIANNDGEAILNFNPSFGITTVYASADGVSVDNEWLIQTKLKISELQTDYFVTDLAMDSTTGDLTMIKTPLADFNAVQDLEGVLLDVSVNNENICLTRFISNYHDDSTIMEGDDIYILDAEDLFNAIIDLEIVDDSLKSIRIGNI